MGPIFAEQIEVTIRHHALESGCFVVNATGWLTEAQIASVTPDTNLQKALRGGCNTAIVSPEGQHLGAPLREGEGMVIADLDMALITKRKRMMDSVGHYARPELLESCDQPAARGDRSRRCRRWSSAAEHRFQLNRGMRAMNSSETLSAASRQLMTELQSAGLRLVVSGCGRGEPAWRRGAIGPQGGDGATA